MLDFFFVVWVLFAIFSSYISKVKFGFATNHYLLTNIYWIICLYISIYHNYYLHPVSDVIYYIFIIGNIFFNLTLYTSNIPKLPNNIDTSIIYSIRKRRILEFVVLGAVIPIAYNNVRTILSGGELWLMYKDYWEAKATNSYLEEFFRQNIVQPISLVLMATCLFSNYSSQNRWNNYLTLFIGASIAVLNMLMTAGGRTGLMQFCFFVFLSYVAFFYIDNKKIIYKISNKVLLGFLSIVVGAFAFATFGRGGEDVLDVVLERISLFPALFEGFYKQTNICDGYTWGASMFESPVSFILYPFKLLGFDVFDDRIGPIISQGIFTPATESEHNAVVSAYLYYMRDFGFLGVALGPYIVGKIYNFLWKILRKDSFLIVFYFSGVCATCLDSGYPFARGYFFGVIYAFLIRKFLMIRK